MNTQPITIENIIKGLPLNKKKIEMNLYSFKLKKTK